MNTALYKFIASGLAAVCVSVPALAAPDATNQPVAATAVLRGIQATEMPAKAAGIVSQAKAGERAAVASDLIREVAAVNPSITHLVVGAISRAAPEAAAAAAGMAAAMQPQEVALFSRAAAAAAPGEAGAIVTALCKVRPELYDISALAVAKAVSGQDEKILQALSVAVPSLKFALDRASAELARSSKKTTVQRVLERVKSYAKWDSKRSEFVDLSGIYRSVATGAAVAGAAGKSGVASPGAVSSSVEAMPPRKATSGTGTGGTKFYYYTATPLVIKPTSATTASGPRDYSGP
jgi:hypothetical protein